MGIIWHTTFVSLSLFNRFQAQLDEVNYFEGLVLDEHHQVTAYKLRNTQGKHKTENKMVRLVVHKSILHVLIS